jgi:hypothetical protein
MQLQGLNVINKHFYHLRPLILFALTLASFFLSSSANAKPFYVTIEGKRTAIKSFQKRAELKMARSTDFCRGFTMPELISVWSCRPSGKGLSKCKAKYDCGLVRKNFSRISETRRLKNELSSIGRTRDSFTMMVGKRPLKNPSKYRYVEAIKQKRESARVARKELLKKQIKKRTKKLKEEMTEYDEFAQLEKELDITPQQSTPSQRKESVDSLSSNSLAEDRRQLQDNQELVAPFRMERSRSNNGNEEIIRIKKREDIVPEDRTFQILSFSGALTQVQDSNASSVATADVAWTPRWQYSPNWAFRGRLGGHFISAEIVKGDNPETFLVYDLTGELEWFPFTGNGFYLQGGLGIQSWTSTTGGAFSTFSMGGGYLFDFNSVKIIDRIFLSYTSVGNDAANTEMRFGIGISF